MQSDSLMLYLSNRQIQQNPRKRRNKSKTRATKIQIAHEMTKQTVETNVETQVAAGWTQVRIRYAGTQWLLFSHPATRVSYDRAAPAALFRTRSELYIASKADWSTWPYGRVSIVWLRRDAPIMGREVLAKVELGGKSNISGVAAPFGLLTLAD